MKTLTKLALAALCGALPLGFALSERAPADTSLDAERPNVVILMTDDQTLRSMVAMPRTRSLLGASGTTFANSFVNNPRCCPSRTTLLTGQYSHNHGVLTNGPPIGGWPRLRGTTNWLPGWLQQAGYHTVQVGKFLNLYGHDDPTEVPPGWDEWYATVDRTTYHYYGYTVNENGVLRSYGRDRDPRAYATDFTARRAVSLVERLAPSPEPFFLDVNFLAPHTGTPREPGDPARLGTPAVAPRHQGAFALAPLPLGGSFNERDVTDKPPGTRRPRLGARAVRDIQALYRQRLESLLAVDEAVEQIVDALRSAGELERTLIVFTSDNGYLAGEHRLRHGKAQVYEPAIRVPLVISGPGVPRGTRRSQLVTNADLAPTVLDAAGAAAGRTMDGRSLIPLARDPLAGRGRPLLIEIARGTGIRTRAIRTARWLYAEHVGGARELYDLRSDPDELRSLSRDPAHAGIRSALARQLRALRACSGASCRRVRARVR